MKIRKDFVTNSSSSSFIIAKNSECTIEEVRRLLIGNRDEIISIMNDFDMETDETSVYSFIDYMSKWLFEMPDNLQLGDWVIGSYIFSNDDEAQDAFVYDYSNLLISDNFKVV